MLVANGGTDLCSAWCVSWSDPQHGPRPGGETLLHGNGIEEREMISEDEGFCYLTRVYGNMRGQANNNFNRCQVITQDGKWFLKKEAGDGGGANDGP